LASGGEAKVVTGVDNHSRSCVIAAVVRRATGRAVCVAFVQALQRFGIPDEELTDNGKQLTHDRQPTTNPAYRPTRPSTPLPDPSCGCMSCGFTGGRLSTLVDVGQLLTAQ